MKKTMQILFLLVSTLLIVLLANNVSVFLNVTPKDQNLMYWGAFVHGFDLNISLISFAIGAALMIWAYIQLNKNKINYGVAKWATLKDIKNYQLDLFASEGIILAKYKGKYIRTNDPLSIMVTAPQGTGKTAGMIVPSLFSYTGSAIINDVKGELWNLTSLQRSYFSTVKLFAPTLGYKSDTVVSFNPIHENAVPSLENYEPFLQKSLPVDKKDHSEYIDNTLSMVFDSRDLEEKKAKDFLFKIINAVVEEKGELNFNEFVQNLEQSEDSQRFLDKLNISNDINIDAREFQLAKDNVMPPYHQYFRDKLIDYLERISSVLYPVDPNDKNKHFTLEAKKMFNFWCVALHLLPKGHKHRAKNKKTGEDTNASIPELYDLAVGATYQNEEDDYGNETFCTVHEIVEACQDEYVTSIGSSLMAKTGDEFSSVKSTFTQRLDAFINPIIRPYVTANDFTWKDFRREKPMTLYIYIPPSEVEKVSPVLTLLNNYLMKEFLSHSWDKKRSPFTVTFFEDEFSRIGKQVDIKESPTLSRSFGIRTVFVHQTEGQMTTLYGEKGYNELMSACDFKCMYQQNDVGTAKKLADIIGKETREKESTSQQDKFLSTKNKSLSLEGQNLVTEQRLLNLPKDKVIIVSKGDASRPIYADICWWFKDPIMKKLAGHYQFNLDLME